MGISLITCTGGRAEALALLEWWLSMQNLPAEPIQWIIVDDCDPASVLTLSESRHLSPLRIRPRHRWSPGGPNTLAANLGAGLEAASYDKILFLEDDEAYLPDYIREMSAMLDAAPLCGQIPARYYHVGTRLYRDMGNYRHASLCQTGIRRELIPQLLAICGDPAGGIDMRLWRSSGLLTYSGLAVGMKGLPGRPGIGIGHRPRGGGWLHDETGSVLSQWLGPTGADKYRKFAV